MIENNILVFLVFFFILLGGFYFLKKDLFISSKKLDTDTSSDIESDTKDIHQTEELCSEKESLIKDISAPNRKHIPSPKDNKALMFKDITILVAEDNIINQKVIRSLLERAGITVIMTSNGKEALEVVTIRYPEIDLIFMDIQMPIMDGIIATKEIMSWENAMVIPHLPIIALTADLTLKQKYEYLDIGMDNFLTKPIELGKMKGMIELYNKRTEG